MGKNKTSNRRLLLVSIPIVAGLVLAGILLSSSILTQPPRNDGGVNEDENSQNGSPNNNPPDHGGGPGGVPVEEIDSTADDIIGFPMDVGFNIGMASILLDDMDDKVSIRFTAKYSGTVDTVVINLLTTGYSTNVTAGIQSDSSGMPNGSWIGKPGIASQAADEDGFLEIKLETPAEVEKGNLYHIVVQPNDPAMLNGVRIRVYSLNSLVQPLNDENLDKPWHDRMMNTVLYDSNRKQWSSQHDWPMFVIKYSDGKSEGQPYSLAAPWIIYGPRYVGQEFVPSSDYVVKDFGFSVSYGGNPADKLYYEVRDSKDKILAKGLFAEASDIEKPRTFIKVELDTPLMLSRDEIYRFVLLSPGTGQKNPYQLYGHEFTYDNEIGYGALRHLLTISYDSGSSWNRWEDADSIFALTTS